jgi:ABC-type multidrug transport system permease subunit
MNNRILGIIGSALLILGLFLPIISFLGFGVSYFDGIKSSPAQAWSGILLLLLGIASLYCALTNKYKILIATGAVSLGLLILDFFRLKSALANSSGEAGDYADRIASAVSIGWGFYVMVIGAILLIVAGVMKNTGPVLNTSYGAPPPPPPYAPR